MTPPLQTVDFKRDLKTAIDVPVSGFFTGRATVRFSADGMLLPPTEKGSLS